MRQDQKAMVYIPMGMSFKSGAMSGQAYSGRIYPARGVEWLQGQDAVDFAEAGPDITYLLRSSGIPMGWRLRDGSWGWIAGDYGKVFARHQALAQRAVEFHQKRHAAAGTGTSQAYAVHL